MFDERAFKKVAKDTLGMMRSLQKFRALFKTEGGRLTEAGKAIIAEGLRAGMKKTEIAALLDVSPSAISYHS